MEDTDDRISTVVINHEEQYSIWPAGRAIPAGWKSAGKTGTKAGRLQYIEEVWTDMRPSLADPALGRVVLVFVRSVLCAARSDRIRRPTARSPSGELA